MDFVFLTCMSRSCGHIGNKGRGRFFIFFICSSFREYIFLHFLQLMRNPLLNTRILAYILSQLSCFLLARAAGPCFPLTRGIYKFYAVILYMIRLLRICKVPTASQSAFIIGQLYSTLDGLCLQK